MIVYQTKHKTVKGISADKVLELAQGSFSKLPSWLKKKFQENQLMLGGTAVQIEGSDRCLVDATGTDIIFINGKNELNVMKEKDFLDVYEDPFANK